MVVWEQLCWSSPICTCSRQDQKPTALTCVPAGLLLTTKVVLSAPLPRVYEETGNGRVAPTGTANGEPGANLIGGDFKVEDLTKVSRETVRMLLVAARGTYMHACKVPSLSTCGTLGRPTQC